VAVLSDIAAGRLGRTRCQAGRETCSWSTAAASFQRSVAVAARLLEVSRTTVEAWRREGVLTPPRGTGGMR